MRIVAQFDEMYAARFHHVTDYIEANLASDLTLDEIASVANFSKFHFHRLFCLYQGETLFQFIRRLRFERAASLLATRPSVPITSVALDCGFENASAFSRGFREFFGVSASEWRSGRCRRAHGTEAADAGASTTGVAGTGSRAGTEAGERIRAMTESWSGHPLRTRSATGGLVWEADRADGRVRTVRVCELDPVEVAYVRHVGRYEADPDLFRRLFGELFTWAGARDLIRFPLQTMCLYHDTPDITPEEKLRVSVCLPVPADTEPSGGVGRLTIPGGKCAIATMELDVTEYGEAWAWTYGYWMARCGFEPDDRTAFERYSAASPEEHETDIQTVEICVPVRPAG